MSAELWSVFETALNSGELSLLPHAVSYRVQQEKIQSAALKETQSRSASQTISQSLSEVSAPREAQKTAQSAQPVLTPTSIPIVYLIL